MPTSELLAALLAYRGLYYLAPLAIAAALYLFLEARISSTWRRPAASTSLIERIAPAAAATGCPARGDPLHLPSPEGRRDRKLTGCTT